MFATEYDRNSSARVNYMAMLSPKQDNYVKLSWGNFLRLHRLNEERRPLIKGSSIIVIIFTSVHSVLFFVTPSPPPPSQKRTLKMLIQNGRGS